MNCQSHKGGKCQIRNSRYSTLGWVDLGIAMDDNFSGSLFPKDLRIAIWNMFRRYSRSYRGAFSACRLALLRMHDGQPLGKCNDKRHEKADGAEYNAVDEFLTGFNVFLGTHRQNPPVPHGVFTSVSLYGSVLLIFRKGFCPASKKKKISAFLAK